MPLQFFSNDFGIKRGGTDRDSKEDEDVQSRAQPQQGRYVVLKVQIFSFLKYLYIISVLNTEIYF